MPFILLCALLTAGPEDHQLSLLTRYPLDCPVCGQNFVTVACTQSNTRGGIDRDLFARALGPQPEFYRISTCPRCGYSGYDTDFDPRLVLPPDVKSRILQDPKLPLPADFGPESDPRELDASVRYELAIRCYTWRQKPDEALAWLNLRAAWVARDAGAVLPRDDRFARVMSYIERYRPPLEPGGNQLDVEMQLATRVAEALALGDFNRYQRPYVELALALILRRHGENRQAAPMLEHLAGETVFEAPMIDAIDRMRASIAVERRYQRQAADHFERALLAESIEPANRGAACYLLGETYRRLGRDAEAARWLSAALADAKLPAELRGWASESLEQARRRP